MKRVQRVIQLNGDNYRAIPPGVDGQRLIWLNVKGPEANLAECKGATWLFRRV
jgi:hypothetical protein